MNRLLKLLLVVLFMSVAAAASAQTLRVTADRTNLRDKASTDGAIVVALSMGEELEVINQTGTWYHVKVKSSGKEGYVSSLVVQVVPGTASGGGARPATAPAPTPAPTPAPRPAAQTAAQAGGFDLLDHLLRRHFFERFAPADVAALRLIFLQRHRSRSARMGKQDALVVDGHAHLPCSSWISCVRASPVRFSQ